MINKTLPLWACYRNIKLGSIFCDNKKGAMGGAGKAFLLSICILSVVFKVTYIDGIS